MERTSNGAGYRDTPYAGASRIRKQLHNWVPARATADADLLPDQDMLIARSRDLYRNNGVAAGILQTLNDNVVGSALRLACDPDYKALKRDIKWKEDWSRTTESVWRTWADSVACDAAGQQTFASLTQLVFRSALENGEALCLPLWLPRNDTPFNTCLQLVDSDRLSNPQFVPASLYLRGGIETDVYGKPVAYHIQKQLNWPGFYYGIYGITGYGISAGLEWERIPAQTSFGRRRVLHVHVKDRIDQTRGKPILAPVIEQFRMLDCYQRTELQSAIVNSIVAGVLETPMDPAGIAEMMGGDPAAYLQSKNEYRVQLEGGTIAPLYPGDKLTPFTPSRPSQQYAAFIEAILRQIGSSTGLPYELVLKDFSKTNYSSARAALNEAWRFFLNRRHWLATYWTAPRVPTLDGRSGQRRVDRGSEFLRERGVLSEGQMDRAGARKRRSDQRSRGRADPHGHVHFNPRGRVRRAGTRLGRSAGATQGGSGPHEGARAGEPADAAAAEGRDGGA